MPDIDAENPPEQQVEEKKEAPASKSMVGIIYPPPEVRSIPQPLHCKWCTLVRTCSPPPLKLNLTCSTFQFLVLLHLLSLVYARHNLFTQLSSWTHVLPDIVDKTADFVARNGKSVVLCFSLLCVRAMVAGSRLHLSSYWLLLLEIETCARLQNLLSGFPIFS